MSLVPSAFSSSIIAVVFSYNCGNYLLDALKSIDAQHTQPDRVIVRDDFSSDPVTLSILCDLPAHYHVIYKSSHKGVLDSLLAALSYVYSNYDNPIISFLDGDDIWHPSKLACVVDEFVASPTASLVSHGYNIIDASGRMLHNYDDQTLRNHWHISSIPSISVRSETLKSDIANFRGVWLGSAFSIRINHEHFQAFYSMISRSKFLQYSHQDQPLAAFIVAFLPDTTFHLLNSELFSYRQHGCNTSSSSSSVSSALFSIQRSTATLSLCLSLYNLSPYVFLPEDIYSNLLLELSYLRFCYTRRLYLAICCWPFLSFNHWTIKASMFECVRLLICTFSPSTFLAIKSRKLTSYIPFNRHKYASS